MSSLSLSCAARRVARSAWLAGLVALVAWAAGCTSEAASVKEPGPETETADREPGDPDVDEGTDPTEATCAPVTGLSPAPESYALPPARCAARFDALASSSKVSYALLDLSGDQAGDLVVTSDQCDSSVGQDHWDVYVAGADGFAQAPTRFAVPAPRCTTSFDALGDVGGKVSFSLLDMDGDRFVDLVVTRDDCDAAVGVDHWDVYRGSPSGFAAKPKAFSVPAPRCQSPFDQLAGSGAVVFSVMNLDGDKVPDLVVARDGCEASVGTTRWDVYKGTSSGFAPKPTTFDLPAARCARAFDSFASVDSMLSWSLLDLDADARADLVVTDDACEAAIGSERWDVYEQTDSGFAPSPRAFALPAPRCNVEYVRTADTGSVKYVLSTFDCDERPDLLVTSDACDETVGATHWDVYTAGPAGFAASPASFAIPAARCNARFDTTAFGSEPLVFGMPKLRGRQADLVVTRDACDVEIGAARWDVYRSR